MVQEVFKKRYITNIELYQAKRWEGRSLGFKLKYLISNHPEMALCTFGFLVLFPAMVTFKYLIFNEEKSMALRKYKDYFAVVRDDDPNIESIMEEKECGRYYFPE